MVGRRKDKKKKMDTGKLDALVKKSIAMLIRGKKVIVNNL